MNWYEDPAEITKRRTLLGVTQKELAEAANVDRSWLTMVEKGQINIGDAKLRPSVKAKRHRVWEALATFENERRDNRPVPLSDLLKPERVKELISSGTPIDAKQMRGLPAGIPLVSLLHVGESPEQRFERELANLKRRAGDLLRTHSSLAKTQDQLLLLYKQDEAQLTDYQKEVRLNTIEILNSTMRQLLEDLQNQVSTIEALSGAGKNPVEAEPVEEAVEEKVSGD